MNVGDRVFLKRRFYSETDKDDVFGTIVEKVMMGTIELFLVKWDKLPVPLQYTEYQLIPAILHEKYQEQVKDILDKGDNGVHNSSTGQSGHQ
jgi:hypothetical protein